jgi:hypothetical protein
MAPCLAAQLVVSLHMETAGLFLSWGTFFALIIGGLCAFVQLWRLRKFELWDALTLLLPVPIWVALSVTQLRPKSLSNLSEAFLLIPLILIVLVVRTYSLSRVPNRVRSVGALVICISAAVLEYAFTPLLPE